MSCEHKWKPIYTATDAGLVSDGYYKCTKCKVIGSKDVYEESGWQVERCYAPDCIAPAVQVNMKGMPLCEKCYTLAFYEV
jgi:hypothetical protein